MSKVNITDTILRDAHQCLIATRMSTKDMLGICPKLDEIGYWSLEVWGGATFDACVRFLKEDPWERLRLLRKALPNTRLQMLLRGQNLLGYRHYPDDVVQEFVKQAANLGIDVFRIFDALNDPRNLESSIKAVKKAGKHAQGAICYTTSPVHTTDKFITLALEMQDMGCDSIAIKDMAGLLTPNASKDLVKALVKKLSVPLHLHSHATSGLANICQYIAAEQGCRHIDTAISAFAEGASHAATETMVAAFADTKYHTGLDLAKLQEIGDYFREVRKKYHQFESEATKTDTRVQLNQVPGGMISNLYHQLQQQNATEHFAAVLAEIPQVREDLGYPPLVTPTSQIVGSQAVLNVITGKRYQTITNEVKLYLQGKYGHPPGAINKEVQQLAIGNTEVISCRPADLLTNEFSKLQAEIGDLAEDPTDVLTYAMFPEIGREYLDQRANGKLTPEVLQAPTNATSTSPSLGKPPADFNVSLHGETYAIQIRGSGERKGQKRPFYVTIDGIPEEVLVEIDDTSWNEQTDQRTTNKPAASTPGDVCASMPGTVVDVLVELNSQVKAGDPVLVIEAMKMETELQAPVSGKVVAINTKKGDTVNPNEALLVIE